MESGSLKRVAEEGTADGLPEAKRIKDDEDTTEGAVAVEPNVTPVEVTKESQSTSAVSAPEEAVKHEQVATSAELKNGDNGSNCKQESEGKEDEGDAPAGTATHTDAAAEPATAASSAVSSAVTPGSDTFASTSKEVREFFLKAASTAARDTGGATKTSTTVTQGTKASGFGGGFGAFKSGPSPLTILAKSGGSGFGGGFGSPAAVTEASAVKAKTLSETLSEKADDQQATSSKVLTGEEGEDTVFEDTAKVYRFDAKELKWRERGKGDLKLQKRVNPEGLARFRILLREPQTKRILVNMSIMQNMPHEKSTNNSRQVRVTGVNIVDDARTINAFMIMVKTSELAHGLREQLSVAMSTLEAQTTKENKEGN